MAIKIYILLLLLITPADICWTLPRNQAVSYYITHSVLSKPSEVELLSFAPFFRAVNGGTRLGQHAKATQRGGCGEVRLLTGPAWLLGMSQRYDKMQTGVIPGCWHWGRKSADSHRASQSFSPQNPNPVQRGTGRGCRKCVASDDHAPERLPANSWHLGKALSPA